MIARGMIALTVVSVLTFFLPLRVATFSVTWMATGPAVSVDYRHNF